MTTLQRDNLAAQKANVQNLHYLNNVPYQQQLYDAAITYIQQGISVLPVAGVDGKKPAVREWESYQNRLATSTEIEDWFLKERITGLAIVLGRISNCMALDIDDANLSTIFAAEHPDLTDTYTVQSAGRGMPHYYYTSPHGVSLKFRGKKGRIELRGDGHIIVAPPTAINGKHYSIIHGGQPRQLTLEQWQRLLAFVDRYSRVSDINVIQPIQPLPLVDQCPDQLIAIYNHALTQCDSRNDALFYTARIARNEGWVEETVYSVLGHPYAVTPPRHNQPQESYEMRLREAQATIHSAFSHKRRHTHLPTGLPTSVREYLCQNKLISVARVLDCLYLSGYKEGDIFTEPQIAEVCGKYHISPNTVRNALRSITPNEHPIFTRLTSTDLQLYPLSSSENSSSVDSASGVFLLDLHSNSTAYNTLRVLGGKKSRKTSKGGRPTTAAAHYTLPSIAELCDLCCVENKGSDKMTLDDLTSSKAYREAVNRGLIERRPHQYSKQLLAKRVKVSRKTMSTYIKSDPHIESESRYSRKKIYFKDIDLLLSENVEDMGWGVWLEVEGRKFAPRRELARKLLGQRKQVYLVRQESNYYHYKEQPASTQMDVVVEAAPQYMGSLEQVSYPVPAHQVISCEAYDQVPLETRLKPQIDETLINPILSAEDGLEVFCFDVGFGQEESVLKPNDLSLVGSEPV